MGYLMSGYFSGRISQHNLVSRCCGGNNTPNPQSTGIRRASFALAFAGVALLALASLPVLAYGQMGGNPGPGIPEDWSHHHAIFSNPGTFDDAMRNGTIDKWSKIVNEPRYQIQQLRHNLWQQPGMGWGHESGPLLKTDWSMNLGSGATVGAGQYPAKYSFNGNASCSDWIAYNTGLAGASGGQANIVAYSNLYDTTCSGSNPSVYWAYFSGTGKATTSAVISLDGSKIAYIENPASGAAILRIIEWKSGQGTPAAAATPQVEFNNAQVGAAGNKAWSSCTAGESCMISVPFQNGDQDTTSSSFYVYFGTYSDTIFVGDNNGKLHQFTGVFNGTPAEVTTNWPVSVSANALTNPVYDTGTSGNIFVADRGATGGFLYAVSPSTHAKVLTTSKLTYASGTVGIVDGPLMDSNAQMVYVFVGSDANTTTTVGCEPGKVTPDNGCSGVFQFPASTTGTGTGACNPTSTTAWPTNSICGEEAVFGTGTVTTPTTYDGAFDQIYYATAAGTAGNLWTCNQHLSSEPRLSYVPIQANGIFVASGSNITVNATTAITTLASAQATCSPLTEIYGAGGTTNDYVFAAVSANGSVGTINTSPSCTGGCVYNFLVGNGATISVPTKATQAIQSTGGSSGIVIDNKGAGTGESQIYYTPMANMACVGNGSTGSGTGGCAVQTSQSAP